MRLIKLVRDERVRGASWCGEKVVEAFLVLANKCVDLGKYMPIAVREALASNPTMASIYNVTYIASKLSDDREALINAMRRLKDYFKSAKELVAKNAVGIISGNVMTISYSSTVLAVLTKVKDELGKVYVMISEPGGEGIIMVRRLRELGINAVPIHDTLIARYVTHVDNVVIGADAIGRDGCVINKVGSYTLALLANQVGIDTYVTTEIIKYHPEKPCHNIEILSREFTIQNYGTIKEPVFEEVPPILIRKVITDQGTTPPIGRGLAEIYKEFIKKYLTPKDVVGT